MTGANAPKEILRREDWSTDIAWVLFLFLWALLSLVCCFYCMFEREGTPPFLLGYVLPLFRMDLIPFESGFGPLGGAPQGMWFSFGCVSVLSFILFFSSTSPRRGEVDA